MQRLLILSRLTSPGQLQLDASTFLKSASTVLLTATLGAGISGALLHLLLTIDDRFVRYRLLSLVVFAVLLCGLATQIFLKVPFLWLLDLRPLLPLPFGFSYLYLLRLVMSTGGLWIAAFGPFGVYLAAAHSPGLGGLSWILAATLLLVWIAGRLATILSLAADYLVSEVVASLLLLVLLVGGYRTMNLIGLSVARGSDLGDLGSGVVESALAEFVTYTPCGWFSTVLLSPRDTSAAIAAVSLMIGLLVLLMVVERRLLLFESYHRRGERRPESSPEMRVLILSLRRLRNLGASTVLLLAEIRCVLQFRPARLCILVCLAFGFVFASTTPTLGLLFPLLFFSLFYHGIRSIPAGSHVWRESLTLPLTILDVVRAPGKSGDLLASALLLCLGSVVAAGADTGWILKSVSLLLAVSIVGLTSAGLGVVHTRWPPRRTSEGRAHPNFLADVASLIALCPAAAVQGAALGLHLLDRDGSSSAALYAWAGVGCSLATWSSWWIARGWQGRFLRRRGAGQLLGTGADDFLSRLA